MKRHISIKINCFDLSEWKVKNENQKIIRYAKILVLLNYEVSTIVAKIN
jgi:hypothetical protein